MVVFVKTSWVIQLSNPEDYEGGDFQYINPTTVFDRLPQHHMVILIL